MGDVRSSNHRASAPPVEPEAMPLPIGNRAQDPSRRENPQIKGIRPRRDRAEPAQELRPRTPSLEPHHQLLDDGRYQSLENAKASAQSHTGNTPAGLVQNRMHKNEAAPVVVRAE